MQYTVLVAVVLVNLLLRLIGEQLHQQHMYIHQIHMRSINDIVIIVLDFIYSQCIVSNKSQIKPKLNVDSSSALKPVPHTKKPVLPRVITTTAHGLLQWSLVLHQQIVTFEIFGE